MYYKLVSGSTSRTFEREVNKYLDLGYKLHGNTFVTHSGYEILYTQPMIKEEK